MRAAAQSKVDGYLEESAQKALRQTGALVPVFEQLARAAGPVHIIQFGDSHTAADEWTGGLREQFRGRFGDGGSGFSLAGHPFPGYRRFDARGGGSTGWVSAGLRAGTGDGWFGLGGVSISTSRPGQTVFLQAECDRLEVHFLQQPGGGRLALYDEDERLENIATEGEMAAGMVRYDMRPGAHRFLLKTLDGRPVRLFGWVADKGTGVTYEALGINGAEATLLLKWDESMLATYLQRREPGLIVLSYGTNEASDPLWHRESYREAFAKVIARLRAAAPAASILVLGPADRWIVTRGRWQLVAGVDDIIAQQESVCKELGCAYWDTRERMGGAGTMRDWQTAGLGQGDRVHFTAAGYHRLANVLYSDLMQLFEAYTKARPNAGEKISHDRPRPNR
uniref:SGNH hydrolase-type esterase domain-containing protein n=1 Tax=Solibacter usitatus (strain Ellin6076) TaxID=234267 RepID=Q01PX4_SOLUE